MATSQECLLVDVHGRGAAVPAKGGPFRSPPSPPGVMVPPTTARGTRPERKGRSITMNRSKGLYSGVAAIAIAATLAGSPSRLAAQQSVSIGATDLGGVVSGRNGPEAGVWVIGERTELPPQMAKI